MGFNIAIIPARGGSKRIPRKNIKCFSGKPIITYSIESAIGSGLFDKVIVSTDDAEIAEIAVAAGASVPFLRSRETSDDTATLTDVLLEVTERLSEQGVVVDNICCILPTAPLIGSKDIIELYNRLKNSPELTSIMPVVRFSYPILRSLAMDEKGEMRFNWEEYLQTRSQDLPTAYHDAGAFYWIRKSALIAERKIITSRCGGVELSEMKVQDIDTIDDWRLAELKYSILYGSQNDIF